MPFSTPLALFALLVSATTAYPTPQDGPVFPINKGCGEVNVFYTGFPAFHPYVAAQGYNTTEVNTGLRKGAAILVKAGYNVRILFQGPDEPASTIGERMKGEHWDVTAQGMGLRGFGNGTATLRFEDNNYEFQRAAPQAPTVYNWGPPSFSETVIRRVPLLEDCAKMNKTGTLIAYEEVCDPSICTTTTVILDGDMDKLLEGIE
ncbi:hypothetical protein BDV95DRAFT_46313 [Massariosphaeria phaeospora]|uniref:Uncharacterized protein n=1 Tax=Massariosphaeria phaeospora TaxID=100035 RepID=A0A7C8IFE3_9PLEO|nr:hypothetical protein BDV95DRAFT_46313 [Massariosphaeria phaeospora]